MAYCNKCGAYIPDGQTGCLACGYDETAESKSSTASFSAAAAAAAQSFSEEVRKKVAEEKQRILEEEEKRRARQENDRKWAEEEYKRRQREKQAEDESRSDGKEGSYSSSRVYTPGEAAAQPNKLLAALSYLSFLWILPFIFCRDDEYAKFHAKQGVRLFILSLFSDVASLIPVVGAVFTLFRFYCIYKGMTNASAGKREALPYIGNIGRF